MTAKERYAEFCRKIYVPIYSKPWWMDAVCGPENWDVWLYEKGGQVLAAMPYYVEQRGPYRYITKAPLTQHNGVLIRYLQEVKGVNKLNFEEEVYQAACDYIAGLHVDVYEQGFRPEVKNWLPFFWNGFTAIPRYTFVIENPANTEETFQNYAHNCRRNVKKGQQNIHEIVSIDEGLFYDEHKKIFAKQGLPCPFSQQLWNTLYSAVKEHDAGKIMAAKDANGNILAAIFLVWDEQSFYLLLGGTMPEFSSTKAYTALVHAAIQSAGKEGKRFDFEGSVIRRINRSAREFGGEQRQYFRIRKVFNPDIIRAEAEEQIERLNVYNARTAHGGG